MKVGDLIRWKYADLGAGDEDIGIVTEVWDNAHGSIEVSAIFADGDQCVNPEAYEVISEVE